MFSKLRKLFSSTSSPQTPAQPPAAPETRGAIPFHPKPPHPAAAAAAGPAAKPPLHIPVEPAAAPAAPQPAAVAPPATPAAAAKPQPPAETPPPTPPSMADVLESFGAIQAILTPEVKKNMVSLPCSVILGKLPEALRGPAWAPTGFPEQTVAFDRADLLTQLKKGRIQCRLGDILKELPAGWAKADAPEAMINLPLPAVVAALPPGLLQGSTQKAELDEASVMKNAIFPAARPRPLPPEAAPAPTEAAPAPTEAAPAPTEAAPAATAGEPAAAAPPPPVELDEENCIAIPFAAMLKKLPASLRGPAWNPDKIPAARLLLNRLEVMLQMKGGSVKIPLPQIFPQIPAGWVVENPTAIIEFDLAQIVAAIPPQFLQGAQQKSALYEEAEKMGSLFTSKRPFVPKPAAPAPAPAPAAPAAPTMAAPPPAAAAPPPVPPKAPAAPAAAAVPPPAPAAPAVPAPAPAPTPVPAPATPAVPAAAAAPPEEERLARHAPKGWDGVEHTLAGATHGVDINAASLEELETIPGVGRARALEIIKHRETQGKFKHIYELARVPGVRMATFNLMTGLNLATGTDRHAKLYRLLRQRPEERLTLAQILDHAIERLGMVGCVLANDDGMPLACTKALADKADGYAALGTQLFRRTGKYLRSITGGEVQCLTLPASAPPLILFASANAFFVFVATEQFMGARDIKKAQAIVNELSWWLSSRAIVRSML